MTEIATLNIYTPTVKPGDTEELSISAQPVAPVTMSSSSTPGLRN